MELHQRLLLSAALLAAWGAAGIDGAVAAAAGSPPSTATPSASTPARGAGAPQLTQLTRLASQGALVSAAVWDLDADRPLVEL